MAEAANPQIIGEFELQYYKDRNLNINRQLDQDYDVITYAFLLDHFVCNLEGEQATKLTSALYELSSNACTAISAGKDLSKEIPLSNDWHISYIKDTKKQDPINIDIKLASIGEGRLAANISNTKTALSKNPELFSEGAGALFVELLHHGSEDSRVLLPILILAQCSWYMERGIPNAELEGIAPNVGLAYIQQISNGESPSDDLQ